MNRYLISGLFYLFFASSFAQDVEVKFENFSTEDGLFGKTVNCIIQDRKGFIWLGTTEGLSLFDGYKFTLFERSNRNSASLSNNYIRSIFEDSKGNIWIGTKGGGLNKFNRQFGTFDHYLNDESDPQSLSHNEVLSITEDGYGNLWVGTENGLNKLNQKTGKFKRYIPEQNQDNGIKAQAVLSLLPDGKGYLWVGTWNGGISRMDVKNETFKHYFKNFPELYNCNAWSMYQDSKGYIWVGTYGLGFLKLNPITEEVKQYHPGKTKPAGLFSPDVTSITEINGRIWVGNLGGLIEFDPVSETIIPHAFFPLYSGRLNNSKILALFKDKAQSLWIGSETEGTFKIDFLQKKFETYLNTDNSTPNSSNAGITAILEDCEGNLWLGKDGGDLTIRKVNGKFKSFLYDPSLPGSLSNNLVTSIFEDSSCEIWIGTLLGLNKYNKSKDNFEQFFHFSPFNKIYGDNWIHDIADASEGSLLLATNSGLKIFDKKTGKFVEHYLPDPTNANTLSHHDLLCLHTDNEGIVWIGTNGGGLNSFNRKTGYFFRYPFNEISGKGIPSGFINTIYEDKKGNMWLGTRDGLVNFDKKKNTFKSYNSENGLSSNLILAILEDQIGRLWISTGKGISSFDPEKEAFLNYNAKDGLQSNNFYRQSYFTNKNGKMFFGGTNGYNSFSPEEIKPNPFIPPVYITDFRIFNIPVAISKHGPLKQSITETKEIVLSYKENILSFEFSALNFILPEKNQYAYKMEGFEENWNYGTKRNATYTNLDPGTYTFKVKASNNDGVWNEKGAEIKVIITPPFWKTWWFRILAVLILLFSIVLFYRIKLRMIRKRKEMLQRIVNERTREIQNQAKEIERMNLLLKEKNKKLEHDVEDITKARVMQENLPFEEFKKIFPDDEACMLHLSNLKWKDGFVCKRCENTTFGPWKTPHSKRCTKCNYVESPTAFTAFHGIKFSLLKGFYMLFLIHSKKTITSECLSETVEVSTTTCKVFKRKILDLISERKLPKKTQTWEDLIFLGSDSK